MDYKLYSKLSLILNEQFEILHRRNSLFIRCFTRLFAGCAYFDKLIFECKFIIVEFVLAFLNFFVKTIKKQLNESDVLKMHYFGCGFICILDKNTRLC